YPISSLRFDKNDKSRRKNYYRIPLNEFKDECTKEALVGTLKSYKYPVQIRLDENIAELCGWYVAEGTSGIYNDKISVGISQQNVENLNRIKTLIENVAYNTLSDFKVSPALADPSSSTYRLSMDNLFFYHLFEALGCGKDAFEKRIPKLILNSNLNIKKAFLTGYFKGDGSKQGKRMVFWTSSDGLRDDLFVLGKELDYIVSIQETTSSSSGNIVYIINFMDIENWEQGSKLHYENIKLKEIIGLRKKEITRIEKTTEYVYDLSVKDNNNFVSANGGIVCHNTDGIWLWVPKLFPLEFPVTVENTNIKNGSKIYKVSLIDKILNDKVAAISRNDNYWINNGDIENIHRSSKSLIQFEQDGPYDFQFMMGKKKYIVYSYSEGKWIEKELTGLESKRADFSKLQKYFQETIINTYLEDFNPENPITLTELYENANRQANRIRSEMIDGRMDPSYFVKPKAINKPLRAYKSKLPQVSAAYILKDLGFSIDPGTRIQMLNIKGNHVIPHQLFDFEFKKIKEVLVKHAIATLSFMLGELSSKEDLMKLIDVKQYTEDIFGPGRIYDRMIKYPKAAQQLTDTRNIEIDLSEIPTTEEQTQKLVEEKQRNMKIEEEIEKPSLQTKKKIRKKTKATRKLAPQSLESLFSDKPKEIILNTKADNQTKVETIRKGPELDLVLEEPPKKIPIITEEELKELETNDIFANGNDLLEDTPNEELIVCSECGALVNPREITREGCTFCGGQLLIQ
ncbi:MAG: LAGLIDADG family homing endonuclease, partial [Candidatus Thorarchaeota archaeon]